MFTFKDYKIIKKIGSGATSDVYLALTSQGEQRALKVFNQMLPIEQGDITFQRELDNLNTLRSERVVRVYGLEKSKSGQWVLIQEYIEGKDLSYILKQEHTQLERVLMCLAIANEVLYALEESHNKGIIHRDIKPENIILHQEGRLVLTDFGLSKNTNINQVTIHGQIFGSPQYMSIDQFSKKDPSPVYDIYSIAVLMYEILAGVTPYQGENIEVILNAKRNGHFKPLEKLNPYTPTELSEVIHSILKNNYGDNLNQVYKLRFKLLNLVDNLGLKSTNVLTSLCSNTSLITDEQNKQLKSNILLQLERSYDSLSKGSQKNNLLGQILKIDNSNKRGVSKSKLIGPLVACSLGIILIASGTWYLVSHLSNTKIDQPGPIVQANQAIAKLKPVEVTPEKNKEVVAVKTDKEIIKPKISKVKKVTKTTQAVQPKKLKSVKPKRPKAQNKKNIVKKKPIKEMVGYLIVNVPSDIRVFVGEQRIVRLGDKLQFPVGKYEVSLKKAGYPTMKSAIEITAGKDTLINLD